MILSAIHPVAAASSASLSPLQSQPSGAASFTNMLASAVADVSGAQSQAESAASNLLLRGEGDVHTVALAAQNAELSLELFQQVRNKLVSAYQEIMKMPI